MLRRSHGFRANKFILVVSMTYNTEALRLIARPAKKLKPADTGFAREITMNIHRLIIEV